MTDKAGSHKQRRANKNHYNAEKPSFNPSPPTVKIKLNIAAASAAAISRKPKKILQRNAGRSGRNLKNGRSSVKNRPKVVLMKDRKSSHRSGAHHPRHLRVENQFQEGAGGDPAVSISREQPLAALRVH